MKSKLLISELTAGRYFSLQEVEDKLKIPKNQIFNASQQLELNVTVIFNKYTVYSKEQVAVLKQFLAPSWRG